VENKTKRTRPTPSEREVGDGGGKEKTEQKSRKSLLTQEWVEGIKRSGTKKKNIYIRFLGEDPAFKKHKKMSRNVL